MSYPNPQAPGFFVPQALLLDKRLTPLERNAWLAFRSQADDDGTVILGHEDLRRFLSSAPGSEKAAPETVSHAVLCLRLSTWIDLIEHRRDPHTGFPLPSRYAVRAAPRPFEEACLADSNYVPLLERALGHSCVTVRRLGQDILDDAWRYPERLAHLPSALREDIARLHRQVYPDRHDDPEDPEGSPPSATSTQSNSQSSANTSISKPTTAVPAAVRTVSNVFKEVRTCRTGMPLHTETSNALMPRLEMPERFQRLTPDQKRCLANRLEDLTLQQRRDVLAEWNVRCAAGYVRDAAAYLYGLIRKALAGTFRLCAARQQVQKEYPRSPVSTSVARPVSPAPETNLHKPSVISREVAQTYLNQIRQMLRNVPHPSTMGSGEFCHASA